MTADDDLEELNQKVCMVCGHELRHHSGSGCYRPGGCTTDGKPSLHSYQSADDVINRILKEATA